MMVMVSEGARGVAAGWLPGGHPSGTGWHWHNTRPVHLFFVVPPAAGPPLKTWGIWGKRRLALWLLRCIIIINTMSCGMDHERSL